MRIVWGLRWVLVFGVVALGSAQVARAGVSLFDWRNAGTAAYQQGTIFNCGAPPRVIDLRVNYSLNPVFVIGEFDPSCPGGFGANPYRFSVTVFRDGAALSTHSFQSSGCWFRDTHVNIPAAAGNYYAKVKFERRAAPWVWNTVDNHQTATVVVKATDATPNFKINGKVIPANDAAIVVPILYPIILDGSSTTCETKYFVGVEESDVSWNRTFRYEWGRWFSGEVPSALNLQTLSTTYSVAPDYLGNDPSRQGTPLVGGFLKPQANQVLRHYRIKLCTGEPSWVCKAALLRVDY